MPGNGPRSSPFSWPGNVSKAKVKSKVELESVCLRGKGMPHTHRETLGKRWDI